MHCYIVPIFYFILYLLTISDVKCSILYEENNKKSSKSNTLIVLSERKVPSKLSCAHYCQIKHGGDYKELWYRNSKCKCLADKPSVEVDGNSTIEVMEDDVYTMVKISKVSL